MFKWLSKLTSRSNPSNGKPAEQIKQWMRDGFEYFQKGNHHAASVIFQKILQVQPDHSDALYLSGVISSNKGQYIEAFGLVSHAIASDASVASFHITLANIQDALGRGDGAIASYRQAVMLDPDDAESRTGLGCALLNLGRYAEALEHFRYASRLAPAAALTHHNLGVSLQGLGENEEAMRSYRDALLLDPAHAQAGNNLGALLHAQGSLDEAIACFRRTLDRSPNFAQAWSNLGVVLQASRRVDEAETCLSRAVSLNPENFSAHSNLALSQREQGKLKASMDSSESALAIQDSLSERIRLATLLPVVAQSRDEIQLWRKHFDVGVSEILALGGTLDDPLREVGTANFNLAYQPESDRELQEKAAQLYIAVCPTLLYTAPHCRRPRQSTGGRIKVGFISKFMHNHSIGRTTRGLLANVARDRFHITAIFVPPLVDDFISQFIRESADDYLVLPSTLEGARTKISELELDILFYQDIGMDAFTYFLAFSRLAPVQCVSFGHPDTTGIPNIDYWVSSENFESEGASTHYSEKLFQLRNLGSLAYYYRPLLLQPGKIRSDFGLAENAHLYLCPQTLFKVHPDFDVILGNILRGDSNGEIILLEARTSSWGDILRERFQETIPDVMSRVRFLPGMSPDNFLALISVCDVMLDTIYFNGMNTSLEAFSVGTPVVTMPTALQRGRHTYGMYKFMGLDECIAQSPEQYVSISLKLGTDKNFREEVKAKILSRSSMLYEDMEVVREFERFFMEAHSREFQSPVKEQNSLEE